MILVLLVIQVLKKYQFVRDQNELVQALRNYIESQKSKPPKGTVGEITEIDFSFTICSLI